MLSVEYSSISKVLAISSHVTGHLVQHLPVRLCSQIISAEKPQCWAAIVWWFPIFVVIKTLITVIEQTVLCNPLHYSIS